VDRVPDGSLVATTIAPVSSASWRPLCEAKFADAQPQNR
jgi:hypothetical protein